MAVGLKMAQVSISGGRKEAQVGTKPVEPVEADNQMLWRAMMWHRMYADSDEFRNGVKIGALPNLNVYEVSLEWISVRGTVSTMWHDSGLHTVSKVEDVEKTTDMTLVIQSCVDKFAESTKGTLYYSTSLLISKDKPVEFPPTQFVRLYPNGPQQETLSQWYLKESLKLIQYVPPIKELHIATPKQLATVTNDEFYDMTFHWKNNISKTPGNLNDIATAVHSQKVLGSDETCILKTYRSTNGFHSMSFWETLPRDRIIGSGSYNKVYLLRTIPETLQGLAKSIVIRQADPKYDLPVDRVLKEMYLTGYASHYELGPKLLASYYLSSDNKNKFSDVVKTVSASVAWDGDCSGLLRDVAGLTSAGLTEDRLPLDFCKKFGELFVDLAKRAADVGLFHGDIKPANMLYSMDGDWEVALDATVHKFENLQQKNLDRSRSIDSLKICMTDFDPKFCHLLPPKDRECAKDCIISATVLMFLAFVRCYGGDEMWTTLRDGMLRPLISAIEPKGECKDKDNSICTYLQYTLLSEERSMETKISKTRTELKSAEKDLKNLYIVIYRNALRRDNSENKKKIDATSVVEGVEKVLRSRTIEQFAATVRKLLQKDDTITDDSQLVTSAKKVAEALTRDKAMKGKLMNALTSVERFYNRIGWLEYRWDLLQDMPSAMKNVAKDDFALDYNGQKLEASQKWQQYIAHYIGTEKYFSRSMEWKRCLEVEEEVSLFDQVWDYALMDKPLVRPNDKSTKRKLDNVTNPTNAKSQQESDASNMDQDVEKSMAAAHAENLKIAVLHFYGKSPDQFHDVETAMKIIVNNVNKTNAGLIYIMQLHDDTTSPAFRAALSNLNDVMMKQTSSNWLEVQKKFVAFLYDIFVDGLHGAVNQADAYRSLGRIRYLYTNLDRFADKGRTRGGEFTHKARKLADEIRGYTLPVAVTTSSS
tara:strand:+ start:1197 stop:3992 length:2796 start_codon:yes stop_codon:yes gene_type:complete